MSIKHTYVFNWFDISTIDNHWIKQRVHHFLVEYTSTSGRTIKRKSSVMVVHVSNCTYHDCNRTASIKTSQLACWMKRSVKICSLCSDLSITYLLYYISWTCLFLDFEIFLIKMNIIKSLNVEFDFFQYKKIKIIHFEF